MIGCLFGNYYEMILATCLGESPLPYWERRQTPCATLARMIRSDKAGIVESISVPMKTDSYINMFIHKGSDVRIFTNSNDAIGEVVVKGDTLKECKEKMVEILSRIKIYYE